MRTTIWTHLEQQQWLLGCKLFGGISRRNVEKQGGASVLNPSSWCQVLRRVAIVGAVAPLLFNAAAQFKRH